MGVHPSLFSLLHPASLAAFANPAAALSPWLAPGLSIPQIQANPMNIYNPWAAYQQAPAAAAPAAKGSKGAKGAKGAKAAEQNALEIASNEAAAEGI